MNFDELFPDAKGPASEAKIAKLEAEKQGLIRDLNFWLRLRDKARKEAMEAGANGSGKEKPPELETRGGQETQQANQEPSAGLAQGASEPC